jgi:stress-induced-phosphoprotein 1
VNEEAKEVFKSGDFPGALKLYEVISKYIL